MNYTPVNKNIAGWKIHQFGVYLPGKIRIFFHGYVNLPEGKDFLGSNQDDSWFHKKSEKDLFHVSSVGKR